MDIASGRPGTHTSPPLDASSIPGVAPPAPIVPGPLAGPTYSARDTTGEFQEQRAAGEADVRAAQATGMSAEQDRRAHYGDGIASGSYGDTMDLPDVPDNAVPPAASDLYPWPGMEPTPAAAGTDSYPGG